MKYIKIRGNNYNEVMMKLKMDHGDDAIPISHKFVKEGGLFNSRFFSKEVVELTAAVQERRGKSGLMGQNKKIDLIVDDPVKKHTAAAKDRDVPVKKGETYKSDVNISSLNKKIDSLNDNLTAFNARSAGQTVDEGKPEEAAAPALSEERIAVKDITPQLTQTGRFEKELAEIKDALKKITSGRLAVSDNLFSDDDINIKPFRELLKSNDFDDEQCNLMISEVKNTISREDLKDRYKIEKSLKDLLKSKIVTTGPLTKGSRKKVIMFVGPTGVGKTTTMAKLGAINSLREGRSVAFITIDNYRIAATEQLKKYAEIMGIPIYTVNSQKEFKDIIARDKADLIMVDTSGRSHRNESKITEIKNFAEAVDCDLEKVLCVSANTKKSDLLDVFRAFNTMKFDSVVITKVDETSFIGNVVDIADKYNKPISYFTNGQEVPNDIVVADADKIVDMMIGNGII